MQTNPEPALQGGRKVRVGISTLTQQHWYNLASFVSIVSSLDTFEKNIFDMEHNLTN